MSRGACDMHVVCIYIHFVGLLPASHRLHPSSFILHPSSFILHPSSFILHPSSFILHPSSFILHPSSFILHPSSFILHPSSFILHPSSSPAKFLCLVEATHYSRGSGICTSTAQNSGRSAAVIP